MNKKGLTLIEIIIALAILAIISSVFLTSMTTYFGFLSRGRDMTEDVFEGQESIEENIEIIKAKIFNDEEVTSDTAVEVTYTLFEDEWAEREVKGYLTEVQLPDNNELAAVIGSEQIKYPVPVAENIDLKIRINNVEQPENYEYINKVNLSLRGDFDLSDPDGVHLTNRHEWFVSRLGFNVPIEQDASLIEEQDPGRLYPIFPNDYDLIPIDASTNNFNYSSINTFEEEYTGRHIVYTVTPFATSGKKGETVFSQPVFLHGPTITDDLVLHLDANMISRDTSISNITYDGDTILLDEWEDLTDNNNDAPTLTTAKPILEEVQYQEDAFSWGKSVIQNEDESTMLKISSFTDSPNDEMTLIFVAKISSNTDSKIISGNSWDFGWNISGNLSFNYGGGRATATSGKGTDDKWHVFTSVVTGGNVDFRIDGNSEGTGTTGGSNPCNSEPFTINLDGVDIAEILIYNDDLNSTDLDEVESQIINKYDPDPADIMTNIMYIKSLPARTVIKNESFTPPNPVEAVMTNGTTQNINVTWNNTVDTSVAGTYNISATADIDNTKSVNLVVNVVEIDYLEHHVTPPIIIEKNTEDYTLPVNLNAKLTNGNDRIVEVTWTSNEADISVAGGILKGTEIGDYTNAITATAYLDSTKSIDYDVKVEKSYVVEFLDYDGTVLKTESVGEGKKATPPTSEPSREGYKFIKWNPKPEDTNITSDFTFTAEYEASEYTLTLNDNYSGGSITTKTVTFDEEYGTLRNPSRSGYDFEGWYTIGDTEIVSTKTVTIPNNHTLYAKWGINSPLIVESISSHDRNSFSLTFSNSIQESTNPGPDGLFNNWSNSIDDNIVSYSWSGNAWRGNYSVEVTDEHEDTVTVNLRLRREGSFWSGYDYYWELR
jgi:uncharacterized repeat protein (TIGR02543 family)/prepilin-type N-terminal cleavage/methylation domain-containing protein